MANVQVFFDERYHYVLHIRCMKSCIKNKAKNEPQNKKQEYTSGYNLILGVTYHYV